MVRPRTAKLLGDYCSEIIRLFLIEGWKVEHIRQQLIHTHPEFESQLTYVMSRQYMRTFSQPPSRGFGAHKITSIHQLKNTLRSHGVHKNLHEADALYIKNSIGSATTTWRCLIFADGILLDNLEVERHYQRKKGHPARSTNLESKRSVKFIRLPFEFIALRQPDKFQRFNDFCSMPGSSLSPPSTLAYGHKTIEASMRET